MCDEVCRFEDVIENTQVLDEVCEARGKGRAPTDSHNRHVLNARIQRSEHARYVCPSREAKLIGVPGYEEAGEVWAL